MSYKANGDFIKVNEHFDNKIIEHLNINELLYTANGNVGIGTNNPQKKLDINGDIRTKKICFVNSDDTDETCIDYSIALLTTEMLRDIMPDDKKDLNQLSSLDTIEIGQIINEINEIETDNSRIIMSEDMENKDFIETDINKVILPEESIIPEESKLIKSEQIQEENF